MGRKGESRERNVSVKEKRQMAETSISCLLQRPQPGTWSAAQARALTSSETSDLSVRSLVFNPQSHTSQGINEVIFICISGKDKGFEIRQIWI